MPEPRGTVVQAVLSPAFHPALRAWFYCQYFLFALLWLVFSVLFIGLCETWWFLAGVLLRRTNLGAPWLSNPWWCFSVYFVGQICVSGLKVSDSVCCLLVSTSLPLP